jgi:hypothetical protein
MTWEQKTIENLEVSREFLKRLRKFHRQRCSGMTGLVRKNPNAALQILRCIRTERAFLMHS